MVERRRNCPGLRRGFLQSTPKGIPSERSALPMPSFFPVGSGEDLVPRKKLGPRKRALPRVPPTTLGPRPQRHTARIRHGSTPPDDGMAKKMWQSRKSKENGSPKKGGCKGPRPPPFAPCRSATPQEYGMAPHRHMTAWQKKWQGPMQRARDSLKRGRGGRQKNW